MKTVARSGPFTYEDFCDLVRRKKADVFSEILSRG